jgi:predicted ATPase/DNA-binding winged helix-turn-helix (wHTH) protein
MTAASEFCFGPFRLDPPNARLTRGRQAVALKPKAFDVLAYLARHADRLVTQDELIRAVWPDTIVGDSSLKSCVRQIRMALGDRVRKPQFIETVHRRGYRFIAPVTTGSPPEPASVPGPVPSGDAAPPTVLVGRETELQHLQQWLAAARGGHRQLVFVAGGPGSGKTALTEGFVNSAVADRRVSVAAGQCFEQFGSGEAYFPVLEALGRLGRGPASERLIRVLAAHAPTWLAHLPGLRPKGTPESAPVAPPERMLREMAEALEQLTADAPLILVLEDLHWADYSTLDLVSALARRREPARLMLLATYRPVEAVLTGHPLRTVKQDLQGRGLCHEVHLGLLTEAAVAEYLAARFPGGGLPDGLSRLLHQRTEGHPLFLVNLVDDWLAQGLFVHRAGGVCELKTDLDALAGGVPASIRALIEKQLERLSRDELRLLEGASVAGVEFAAAAAAAAVEEDLVRAEECCEVLARRHHFLHPGGSAEWPDGTTSGRYRFGHELYHRVVFDRVAAARRRLLHQRLAERLEAAHAARPGEAAAELALHFDQGRDPGRAVRYFEMAADRATRQYAHREAIDYLRRGLAAVPRLPEPEREPPELRLQLNLGLQLQLTQGFASPEARRAYLRARDLCRRAGEDPLLFPVLWGLWLFHKVRSEIPRARTMAEELFALAQQLGNPALLLQAHQALAVTTLCAGEPAATRRHMERGAALYDPERHHAHTFLFGQDPGVACRAFGAVALWLLGYPEQAVRVSREASRLSHELVQPSSQALALHFAAMVHQCRRDGPATLACAELTLTIAADQGLSFWQAGGTVMRGWAVAERGDAAEGIALMRQGLDTWQDTGSVTYRTYFLALLSEALGRQGRAAEGLQLVDEALALIERTSERLFEPELHRLQGDLLLVRGDDGDEAEACFRRALDLARRQQAKSLELRAVMGLSRAALKTNRRGDARTQLAETLGWFTEGFETHDLREARALLDRER